MGSPRKAMATADEKIGFVFAIGETLDAPIFVTAKYKTPRHSRVPTTPARAYHAIPSSEIAPEGSTNGMRNVKRTVETARLAMNPPELDAPERKPFLARMLVVAKEKDARSAKNIPATFTLGTQTTSGDSANKSDCLHRTGSDSFRRWTDALPSLAAA